MADVTLDLENANPKELYGQGVRAYVLQDYDTAVHAFSKASELLVAEHGKDTADSLGDVYLYYGKSLLELSRKESGPLGEAVLKDVEEESETEEAEEEDENKEVTQDETSEGKTDPVPEDDSKEEKPEDVQDEDKTDKTEGSDVEEDLTDLQLAWEVLELAKKIFTDRGTDGRKSLADTLIVLGEISLESGNFPPAIDDIKQGLDIQKTLFGNDNRTIAETFYKLGGAYATNAQIDEAIDCFTSSLEYLENKVSNLKKEEDSNVEEIDEINNLIPEIQEKIADMKNLKAEIAKKVTSDAPPKTNGTSSGASSSKQAKQVNDISHLVKRKRKEDELPEENPSKKPSP